MVFSQKGGVSLLAIIIVVLVVGIGFYSANQKKTLPADSASKIPTSQPEQDKTYTLKWEGKDRSYEVHMPPRYEENVSVVIVFHGGLSNIDQAKKTLGFNKTADKNNFLVVYPQALGSKVGEQYLGQWNAGSCCQDGKVDDIGFITQLLSEIKETYQIDEKRVYVTGISNGSMMAFETACELPNQIAAVGGVAGQGVMDGCAKKPLPAIYFHGQADKCLPINGTSPGTCYDEYFKQVLGFTIPLSKWTIDSVPDFIKKLQQHNDLFGDGQKVFQNKSAICTTWGKDTRQELEFCTVGNLGHTWPGQTSYGNDCAKGMDTQCKATMAALGDLNSDVIANDRIWDFFQRHPKN